MPLPVPCLPAACPSLPLLQAAAYDKYYVKYDGISKFGQDKSHGSDCMLLPDRLCIGIIHCESAPLFPSSSFQCPQAASAASGTPG